jgi:5-hydroxyisourate hydrolase-like protein (transthyretin family)
MLRIYLGFVLSAMLLMILGCKDKPQPEDLPKLYPCIVTITQDGKPLEDAAVELIAEDQSNAKYQPVTKTDTEGKAVMSTYGYKGAPAGKYKVVISKKIDDDFVYGTSSTGDKEVQKYNTYRTVEPKYSDSKTTPHEIEVTGKEKTVEATFDVGKAIKVRY